jgi:hypothetical protein
MDRKYHTDARDNADDGVDPPKVPTQHPRVQRHATSISTAQNSLSAISSNFKRNYPSRHVATVDSPVLEAT